MSTNANHSSEFAYPSWWDLAVPARANIQFCPIASNTCIVAPMPDGTGATIESAQLPRGDAGSAGLGYTALPMDRSSAERDGVSMVRVFRYGGPLALGAGGAGLIGAGVLFGLAFLMILAGIELLAVAITAAPKGARRIPMQLGFNEASSLAGLNPGARAPIVIFDGLVSREQATTTQADIVVLRRDDGMWVVTKDRDGRALSPRPWDELPARLKDAIGSAMV
jgi:hypothetical protein